MIPAWCNAALSSGTVKVCVRLSMEPVTAVLSRYVPTVHKIQSLRKQTLFLQLSFVCHATLQCTELLSQLLTKSKNLQCLHCFYSVSFSSKNYWWRLTWTLPQTKEIIILDFVFISIKRPLKPLHFPHCYYANGWERLFKNLRKLHILL